MKTKHLKILQIINFYSPSQGGSAHNTYNLSRKLVEFGHEVTVCSTDYKYDPGFVNGSKEVKAVLFPCIGPVAQYSPAMKKWLEENVAKYDVLHLNNYWSYQNVIASKAAKKHAIPYVLSPRGSLPIQMKSYLMKYVFDVIFGKAVIGDAAAVVGTTQMEIEQIKKKGKLKGEAVLIPNAVDAPPKTENEVGVFKARYGIPKENRIILFLARIHKIKGLDLLISSFFETKKSQKNISLVISGPDGGALDDAQRMSKAYGLEDSVVFTGPLYGNDKYCAYSSSDIYVLPSRYEIFGNTILEACSCGKPVITTDRCGIAPEIRGVAGEVVRFDKEELSSAMIRLLDSPELCVRYGEQGKRLVAERFTWEKIAKQFENAYRRAIELQRRV